MVRRKILVLDLDETLIHSHHDGVIRQTVKPGTPPDFVLKVTIDRHPVRFFVHKRPHVDFFLDIVSCKRVRVAAVSSVTLTMFDFFAGFTVVHFSNFYRQHGDLWSSCGRQAGQSERYAAEALLPAALHDGLRQLHKESRNDLDGPVVHIHPG